MKGLLWLGVVAGVLLVAVGMMMPGPWIGTVAGVVLVAGCGAALTDRHYRDLAENEGLFEPYR